MKSLYLGKVFWKWKVWWKIWEDWLLFVERGSLNEGIFDNNLLLFILNLNKCFIFMKEDLVKFVILFMEFDIFIVENW